jgi:hypothetical protein
VFRGPGRFLVDDRGSRFGPASRPGLSSDEERASRRSWLRGDRSRAIEAFLGVGVRSVRTMLRQRTEMPYSPDEQTSDPAKRRSTEPRAALGGRGLVVSEAARRRLGSRRSVRQHDWEG